MRFLGSKKRIPNRKANLLNHDNNVANETILKPKKSVLPDIENGYYQKFLSMLENDRIYLDPLLSLEQVASNLEISPGPSQYRKKN